MPAQKADFTDVYMRPDPRGYYQTLGKLDYTIPAHGTPVFDAVLGTLRDGGGGTPRVLDLCCSYGVNAALLNHDVTLADIEEHYADAAGLSRTELIERDRAWYRSRRRSDAVDVVGLDISAPAVDYAIEAGLLVDGVAADLEENVLTDEDAAKLIDIDLVTVTGGIGYINDRTFDQILDAADETPWVAALSLRWIDFEPVAQSLDAHGLVTERLDDYVVPQRRFADPDEQRFVYDQLASRGVEPTGVEESGHHGAELYVARPADSKVDAAIEDVFADIVEGAVAED